MNKKMLAIERITCNIKYIKPFSLKIYNTAI